MERLTIKHNDAGFTDYSKLAQDFTRDDFVIQMKTTSTLYVGFRKPFNFFYNEFKVANTSVNELTVQYYDIDDDALADVPNLEDETSGFNRSGFIKFDRPEDDSANTKWKLTTVDGVELYWLVITTDVDHDALTEVRGMNILFSNDQDLIKEKNNIVSKYAKGESTLSWVAKHQASRDEIVQALRTQGKRKVVDGGVLTPTRFMDITYFDILRVDQIREASKWLTLSKICLYDLADSNDDKWTRLGNSFYKKYTEAFDLFLLSLDTDDDGEEDQAENTEDAKRITLSFT